MRRLANDPILKKQLLSRYLWPGMGLDCGPDDDLTADVARLCQRHEVLRGEHFELAGPYEAGQAFVFEHALSHSYFHYPDTGDEQGAAIYRPHELIFQHDSLLYKEERLASLQALEPGGLLAVPYPALRLLMGRHRPLHDAVLRVTRERERKLNELGRFLGMQTDARYKAFLQAHRPILHRIPQRVQALHLNVSRSHLNTLSKKFGGNG